MSEERIEAIQTRWSLVRAAHLSGRSESVSEARQLLVMKYAPAIRRYVGAMLRNDDEADDVSQEIMLRLMQGDFAGADPGRGRFRDLLKTAIRNMVRSFREKSSRRKVVDADPALVERSSETHEEAEWLCVWQKSVLDQTWDRMRAEDGESPGAAWQVLKLRAEFPDASSEELAERLSLKSGTMIRADYCRQLLKRARSRFVAHLLDEVRAGLDSESEDRLQEELAALGLLELVRDHLARSEK